MSGHTGREQVFVVIAEVLCCYSILRHDALLWHSIALFSVVVRMMHLANPLVARDVGEVLRPCIKLVKF